MAKLADAEKLNGNAHWTLYDGRGGVWRAQSFQRGLWGASKQTRDGLAGYYSGKTLREVRAKVAEGK